MVLKSSRSGTAPQELTKEQVLLLKELLLKGKNIILAKETQRKQDGAYQISRDDISDETDLASVETDQDVNMKLADADRHKLTMIDKALKKIDLGDGSYGLCEGTGEPIGFNRLNVQPWALYSLRYQEDLERGRRAMV